MRRKRTKSAFYVTTNEAGQVVALTTRRPTPEAIARIGQPVKVEPLPRPPRQLVMDTLEADAFALHA